MSDVVNALASVVGHDHVLVEPDLVAGYEVDWTGRFRGPAAAVVRPADTSEVAAVVDACRAAGATIIAQGGNTGLVGGSVPRTIGENQVVLSTRRLTETGDVDLDAMQITVGAGVTIDAWRTAARSAGLDIPVDFAARESATIGGAISTNAGGSRVVRFGTMRRQVVGIEAVLADGSTIGDLGGLPKETVGIHWPSVLTGAEGTLGIVTRARLRLVPWFRSTTTAMVALDSIDSALRLLGALRSRLDSLDSVELIQPEALDLVSRHLGVGPPLADPAASTYVVIDAAGHVDPTDDLVSVLSDSPGVVATAMAVEPAQRSDLLAFRDRLTEAIAAASTDLGVPTFKLDVAVPVTRLRALLDVAGAAARDDGCRLVAFGHLAEGNLHLNHLGATDADAIAATVLAAVAEMGGTISAEHGVGVAKARWMELIRTEADLAAQRSITAALDPGRLLNPGVLGR